MAKSAFEESASWIRAREIVKLVYKHFGKQRDFGFRDQILRAAVSVMNNIAEGFERGTQKELRQFLSIAQGSCGELRSMLYSALDLGYISSSEFDTVHKATKEESKMLSAFIRKL